MDTNYRDREGHIIDLMKWADLFEDINYRFIADDYVGLTRVATIWVGHNLDYFSDQPLIFETTIFSPDSRINGYQLLYASEGAAREGHRQILAILPFLQNKSG